jgi:hypothetical protein
MRGERRQRWDQRQRKYLINGDFPLWRLAAVAHAWCKLIPSRLRRSLTDHDSSYLDCWVVLVAFVGWKVGGFQ